MIGVKEKLDSINSRLTALFKAERQTMTAFKGLSDAATRPGEVTAKVKELTAVAIAVAKGCDDCIVYHTAAAKKHGAGRQEFIEILAVAIEMAGGLGAVYAAKALRILTTSRNPRRNCGYTGDIDKLECSISLATIRVLHVRAIPKRSIGLTSRSCASPLGLG